MATRFGAYEILHELKSGGMGAVLLGRRRGPGSFEQLVAIKTIRPEYANTAAVRAMFLDEAAILARLNHPAIATVHDFGEEGGTLYMVMEYVAGISFRAITDLKMSPGVAARAIAEACRGLHAAHELRDLGGTVLGVVHRDISPDNLLMGYDGHVKVIDFGIALVKNRQSPVTEFGTVKGKPPYMSPEQVKNESMDRRSDVFSLAVVLHEMLTGQALFDGDSIYAIARAVEHQEILPPSRVIGAQLPLGLDATVMNALDRDASRRTPSAAAFAEQLEQVINNAGDETLEAWADRELAEPRTAHRNWLASIVAGRDAPRPVGRATGSATQLAPIKESTQSAPISSASLPAAEDSAEPSPPTHLAATTGDDDLVPARKSYALPILLALLVLGGVIGGVMFMRRDRTAAAPPDGAVVAFGADAATADAYEVIVPRDAAAMVPPLDAAVVDLPVARDAGLRRPPRDSGGAMTVARDAPMPVDAAAVAAGIGKITIKHRAGGSFLNVLVDGKLFGNTPLFGKKLEAGVHVIELVAPDTGAIVHKQTVTIEDGKSASVTQP